MKKLILTCMAFAISMMAFGQAKKPTIMVVPSDTWCSEHGFMKSFDENGDIKKVPDYERALLEDGDLKVAINTISGLLQDRGFPPVDMEHNLKRLSNQRARNTLARSKTSGAEIAENPIDALKKVAKSDIIFDLYWKVNQRGPNKSVTYTLAAKDAYSSKQIATTAGTGPNSSSAVLAELLMEAVIGTMGQVEERLMKHFEDMAANGREVSLEILTWDNSPYDLEHEIGGVELSDIIENWVSDNTVRNVYSLFDGSETFMQFDQVRIPLYGANGRPIAASDWAKDLRAFLKTKGIDSKLLDKNLGLATIVIGEK